MFFILNLPAVLIAFLKEKDCSNFVGNTLGMRNRGLPLGSRTGPTEDFNKLPQSAPLRPPNPTINIPKWSRDIAKELGAPNKYGEGRKG